MSVATIFDPSNHGTNRTSPEGGEVEQFGFSDKSIRRGFIKKVYSILSVQLILTFGIVSLFVFVDEIKQFSLENRWILWVALGVTFVSLIILACCGSVRRKTPQNYIFLLLFTLAEGFLLGCVSATYDLWEVLGAVGVTIVVTIALTLFAFQTKFDFTILGGGLFVCAIVFLIFGIFAAIFTSQIVRLVYSCVGALLFSVYLVYDTQMMMGGKHKYSISPEEYIFAALNLYVDVVQIFMMVLGIFGNSGD